MTEKHVEISEYADELISVPRARVMLELAQVESGVTLTHEGRMLVSCRLTSEGMAASGFMAKASGREHSGARGDGGGAGYDCGAVSGVEHRWAGLCERGVVCAAGADAGGGRDAEGWGRGSRVMAQWTFKCCVIMLRTS